MFKVYNTVVANRYYCCGLRASLSNLALFSAVRIQIFMLRPDVQACLGPFYIGPFFFFF